MTTERTFFRSRPFAVGATQAVVLLVLGVIALSVVPLINGIFQDFGMALSAMTVAVLSVIGLLGRFWYLGLVLVLVWPFVSYGVVVLLSRRPETEALKQVWYFVTWGAIILVTLFAIFALARPMVVLVTPYTLSHA